MKISTSFLTPVLAVMLLGGNALASDEQLLRCGQVVEASARLACFDALVIQLRTTATAPSAQRKVADFGLEAQASKDELEAIESRIAGRFEGWRAGQRLTLANGQVWQIADDSSAFANATDPKVRIRRGAIGAFYLEVEGTRRSPRVRRVE